MRPFTLAVAAMVATSLPSLALAQTRASTPPRDSGQLAPPAQSAAPRIEIFVLEPEYESLTLSGDLFDWTTEDRIAQEANDQCRTAAGPVAGTTRALSWRLGTTISARGTPPGAPQAGHRYFKRLVCEVRY
jgi:hypothetical protein